MKKVWGLTKMQTSSIKQNGYRKILSNVWKSSSPNISKTDFTLTVQLKNITGTKNCGKAVS